MQEYYECSECGVELSGPGMCQDCWDAQNQHEGYRQPRGIGELVKSKGIFIALGLVLLIITGAGGFYVYGLYKPALDVYSAVQGLKLEVDQRLEMTPLPQFMGIKDILKDGTLELSIDAVSIENSIVDTSETERVLMNLTVHSDQINRQFALTGSMKQDASNGGDLDFQLHLNPTRFAWGASLLGEDLFGFDFGTLREDLQVLGENFGFEQEQLDAVADSMEVLEGMLSSSSESEGLEKSDESPYDKVIKDFFIANLQEPEDVKVIRKDKEVTLKKIAMVITPEEVQGLWDEFERIKAEGVESSSDYKLLETFMDEYTEQFEQNLEGMVKAGSSIEIELYVGKANRLSQVSMVFNYDNAEMSVSWDLGTSISDDWVFDVLLRDPEQETVELSFVWGFLDAKETAENKLIMYDESGKLGAFNLIWNKASGEFTVEETEGDQDPKTVAKGKLIKQDNGFIFNCNEVEDSAGKIVLKVYKGANIPQDVEFINIRDLDPMFVLGIIGSMNSGTALDQ